LHLENSEFIAAVKEISSVRQSSSKSKDEMGGACSSYGGGERRGENFGGNIKERDHWGDPGVDGIIILRRVFKK
jgi:hypothetical protein